MKRFILLFSVFLGIQSASAQDIFKQHGFTKEPLTLSNGKYKEFFENQTIVQIGTVLLNTVTNEVVAFVNEDTTEFTYPAELSSRWLCPDPKTEEYPSWSPYNYVLNNPMRYIDPNGEDVYLIIWASQDGRIGHAGLAVDNYKTEEVKDKNGNTVLDKNGKPVTQQVKDGTVTYHDLWPGGEGANKDNATDDIQSSYNSTVTTLDKLQNSDVTGSEGYVPDAVVQLKTDSQTDAIVNMALNSHQKVNKSYNGVTNNCSDYAKSGVEYAAPYGSQLSNTDETIGSRNATTPNQLYKATVKLPNSTVIKNPGNKVNTKFIDAITGGSGTARKVVEKRMD